MDFTSSKKLSDFIWINGEFVPWDEAYIHVLTHSLHYAGAVFEGERAYNGKIFKLTEHTNRLLKSAAYMHLEVPYSVEEINAATEELLKKNNLKNAYVRPLIWRGAESVGLVAPTLTTNILILMQQSNPPFRNGLALTVSPWRKVAANAMPVQSKSSAHYAMPAIAERAAQNAGYDDALMLDQYGDIAECSTTNIFFGKHGELITPIADRFLNGITRQTVIDIARGLGIKVTEERIALNDLRMYDTCFQTGTAAEIYGVSSINIGKKIVEFSDHKMISILQQEFAKITGKIL